MWWLIYRPYSYFKPVLLHMNASCLSLVAAQCWKLLFLFRSDGEIKAQLKKEPNWKKLKTLELWCLQRSLIHHGLTTPCTNLSAPRSGTLPSRCSVFSFILIMLFIDSLNHSDRNLVFCACNSYLMFESVIWDQMSVHMFLITTSMTCI